MFVRKVGGWNDVLSELANHMVWTCTQWVSTHRPTLRLLHGLSPADAHLLGSRRNCLLTCLWAHYSFVVVISMQCSLGRECIVIIQCTLAWIQICVLGTLTPKHIHLPYFSSSTWKKGGVWMCKLSVISQERLKIEVKLLIAANSKSYMPCWLAQQWMTLSDL